MRYGSLALAGALSVVLALAFPAAIQVAAQTKATPAPAAAPAKTAYVPPRTPWGDPDLQGVYDYQSLVPMQRPTELAGKATFTPSEYEEWAKTHQPTVTGYNEWWNNRNFVKEYRTSLIIEPPDGRIPPMTPEALKKQKEIRDRAGDVTRGGPLGGDQLYLSWEDFGTVTRCIAEQTPNGVQQYNSGTYIMQSPGWLMIVRERLDTRYIALDGRPHVGSGIHQYNGDSRGHFEGNTLVVDTTNFTDKQDRAGIGATVPAGIPLGNLHLTERFVPVSPTRIEYYATLDDPKTWTGPWTFMLPWEKDSTYQIYEYACNEGNISLGNALRGERARGR